MSRISKRDLKKIQEVSVFDSILRERFTSSLTGYFADERPEFWNDDERQAFDMACDVEHRLREEILKALGVTPNAQST